MPRAATPGLVLVLLMSCASARPSLERSDEPSAPNSATSSDRNSNLSPTIISAPVRVYSHTSDVHAVAFSPDGQSLATADASGHIYLWPLGMEDVDRQFTLGRRAITALAFSPDGATLASGSKDGWVKIYDLKQNKPQAWLEFRHRGAVTSVGFSSSGDEIVSASEDDSIVMRNTVTSKRVLAYFGHSADVTAMVFSPDGRCVLSGSEDRSLQSWSTESGEQIDFSIQKAKVVSVAEASDGRRLAAGLADGQVLVRRTDGCSLNTIAQRLAFHTGAVSAVVFSRDGLTLYSGSEDRQVLKWDLDRGQVTEIIEGHQGGITALSISPDGSLLASASRDGTVRLWRIGDRAGVALPADASSGPGNLAAPIQTNSGSTLPRVSSQLMPEIPRIQVPTPTPSPMIPKRPATVDDP